MMLVLIFAFTAGGVAHHIVGLSLLIRALLKMLCQRALLKMPSQLIRALLKMKAGVANTSSAQDAVTANTSPAQDAYPANTSSAQYKSWRCFQDDQHEGETGSSSWSTSPFIYVCNVFY